MRRHVGKRSSAVSALFVAVLVLAATPVLSNPTSGAVAVERQGSVQPVSAGALPVALDGWLVAADGRPLGGRTLSLGYASAATPTSDVGVTRFASAVTAADGSFHLAGDVPDLRGNVATSPDAWAQLELAGSGVAYNFPAVVDEEDPSVLRLRISADTPVVGNPEAANGYELVVSPADGGAVDVSAEEASRVPGGPARTRKLAKVERGGAATRSADASSVAAAVDDGGSLEPAPAGETDTDESTAGTDTDTAAGVDSTDCRSGYTKYWEPKDITKQGWVPSKWFRTQDKGQLAWEIQRTHETSMQIAYTATGKQWSGGLTGAKTQSSSMTLKPKVNNNVRKLFKLHFEYQKERAYCLYYEIEAPVAYKYYLNHWRWTPTRLTGSQMFNTTVANPCGGVGPAYMDTFGAEMSVARSSVVTYSNWFTIAGVKLDARSVDGAYEAFYIKPNDGKNVKLCGNNDEPLYADQVQEVN